VKTEIFSTLDQLRSRHPNVVLSIESENEAQYPDAEFFSAVHGDDGMCILYTVSDPVSLLDRDSTHPEQICVNEVNREKPGPHFLFVTPVGYSDQDDPDDHEPEVMTSLDEYYVVSEQESKKLYVNYMNGDDQA